MRILGNISLKKFSTFKVEANARYFVDITQKEQIKELISTKIFKKSRYYILGKGANTLFKDNFDGLIIKISIPGKEILSENNKYVLLKIGGGEDWTDLVKYTVKNNWSGLESLAYIPGTVGASPVQNIGAYGQEIANVFEYLEAIEIASGEEVIFNKEECEFEYRDSIFKRGAKGKYIITAVILKLNKTANQIFLSSSPQYSSQKSELEEKEKESYTLQDIYDATVSIRRKKLPSIEEYGSAGSFFTNPIITGHRLSKIQKDFPDIPYFETDSPDLFKIPTGWVLEQLGWKGTRDGDVGTWKNHSLIVVNYGEATGDDILAFTDKIIEDFRRKTDISLIPEVNII